MRQSYCTVYYRYRYIKSEIRVLIVVQGYNYIKRLIRNDIKATNINPITTRNT